MLAQWALRSAFSSALDAALTRKLDFAERLQEARFHEVVRAQTSPCTARRRRQDRVVLASLVDAVADAS
jgi:hypothetical protein